MRFNNKAVSFAPLIMRTTTPLLPNKKLGRLVRAKRKELRLGLREFAKRAGVDHTVVFRLEQGHDTRSSTVAKIMKAYDLSAG